MFTPPDDGIDNTAPFYSRVHKAWFFYDETGDTMGPFKTEKKAMKEMKAYGHFLNHGPTLWQRIWWPFRWGFLARFTEKKPYTYEQPE